MRIIFLVFFLGFFNVLSGQKSFRLQYVIPETTIQKRKELKDQVFVDSLDMMRTIGQEIKTFKNEGYVTANLDSLRCKNDSCFAFIYIGQKYSFDILEFDSNVFTEDYFINSNKKSPKDKYNPLHWPEYAGNITKYYLDRGYPFCKVFLEDIYIQNDIVKAKVNIKKGELVRHDSILIKGDLSLSKNFIYRYFHIKSNLPYNHSQILLFSSRSKNLLFARQSADPLVKFDNNKAITYLYLNRNPINKFDFILGILPNSNPAEGSNRWTISGDLKMEFYNRFGQGEYIFGQYKKLKPENQEIILKFSIPYVYNFAFGFDSDFRLFRNGNEHLDLFFTGGIQFLFNGLSNVKFGYHFKSSRLIEVNTQGIINSGKLPLNLDIIYRSGVFSLQILQTDYRFNPSKGWLVDGRINIGQKLVLENALITALPGFENIYDGVTKPTLQFESEWDAQYFVPVKTFGAIRFRGMAGIKFNSSGIRQNEFFRLGGSATLRGFDEESIWADRFFMLSTEFRLFLDRNSFLSLPFIDFALTRILQDDILIVDDAIGLGMGLNFSTRAGIFNVSFAAGNRLNTGFNFGNMKVHFGYISLF